MNPSRFAWLFLVVVLALVLYESRPADAADAQAAAAPKSETGKAAPQSAAAGLTFESMETSGSLRTLRAEVPGGWLVVVMGPPSRDGAAGVGVTFYPDPAHRWDAKRALATRSPMRFDAGAEAKYDKLSKQELQEELKKLQKESLAAERDAREAGQAARRAEQTYNSAPDDQKPEALLRMLEARAAVSKPQSRFSQLERDFRAAQQAYQKLLMKD